MILRFPPHLSFDRSWTPYFMMLRDRWDQGVHVSGGSAHSWMHLSHLPCMSVSVCLGQRSSLLVQQFAHAIHVWSRFDVLSARWALWSTRKEHVWVQTLRCSGTWNGHARGCQYSRAFSPLYKFGISLSGVLICLTATASFNSKLSPALTADFFKHACEHIHTSFQKLCLHHHTARKFRHIRRMLGTGVMLRSALHSVMFREKLSF